MNKPTNDQAGRRIYSITSYPTYIQPIHISSFGRRWSCKKKPEKKTRKNRIGQFSATALIHPQPFIGSSDAMCICNSRRIIYMYYCDFSFFSHSPSRLHQHYYIYSTYKDILTYLPAKLHARKVAKELGTDTGLIFLPGQLESTWEDSDQGPPFRQRR